MDPSRKVPLCPKKTRQNDPRDEMIDEKSFSCPFFCHSFLFQWDLLFFFCFGRGQFKFGPNGPSMVILLPT